MTIPTYEIGQPEKNPIFLEKRVYQGSSGVVYPYPVIESISDEKTDKEWMAVFLENEYIKVMVLPELGGRIQMAYDKIRGRHFVYYNHVIKPALVGLTGPWISGGIEFNWPQHHRPSTYLPTDCDIVENEDGSVTVWINEMERMFHQKGMAGFTLRPGCAYLEIQGRVSNRTPLPQTFLWWANPAVEVNDEYQSVFPPDVNAVFDHGKRAVSSFPIATGTYYKMDYSAGVDISNYRNIKVPTSYMAVNSKYNFEGGYENDTQAGMLHVASHHFSPGKKQWTWGNGDFGRAWDRNLTDKVENGEWRMENQRSLAEGKSNCDNLSSAESAQNTASTSNHNSTFYTLHSTFIIFLSALLVLFGSLNYWTWLFVPAFVVTGAIATVKLLIACKGFLSPLSSLLSPLSWLGSISAMLFVMHPVMRELIIGHYRKVDIYGGIFIYLLSSVALAMLLKWILRYIPKP